MKKFSIISLVVGILLFTPILSIIFQATGICHAAEVGPAAEVDCKGVGEPLLFFIDLPYGLWWYFIILLVLYPIQLLIAVLLLLTCLYIIYSWFNKRRKRIASKGK